MLPSSRILLCDHVDNSFLPLPRVLSSTHTHPLAFCEKWFIFFFRHIATEAECLALAKEGWGFVQLSVRKASLFDWQRASSFAYFCLERWERERGRGRRETISPRPWKRGKTLLLDDCCCDTSSLDVLSCLPPLFNVIHFWLEYFVGRPKLSAISSIISCRPTGWQPVTLTILRPPSENFRSRLSFLSFMRDS